MPRDCVNWFLPRLKFNPGAKTDWSNLWLAGDWTDTGYPATIESAILSGLRAARAVDAAAMEIRLQSEAMA